ncbi:MAG: DUF503 domain-containing protein [Candidatus Marinimicrobia bacterium]|nr:DUF503 domain-containing protein [Candidatus Neomarinimicrobiota bacterium]
MTIGYLQLDLYLPGVNSIKHKRSVVSSIKNRLRNKYNIAIAEMNANSHWSRVSLGITTLSDSYNIVNNILNDVERYIEANFEVSIINRNIEFL